MESRSLRRITIPTLLVCLAWASPRAVAAESLDESLHIAVSSIQKAAGPVVLHDAAIFTSGFRARSVGVAFQHEDFRIVHPMEINRYGIFFLVYALPAGVSEPLRYRFVVDGAWIRDPLNDETARDPDTGAALSVLRFDRLSEDAPGSYRILEGRTATFTYRAAAGDRVYLSGSFNDWDPFMYPMPEVEPGLFRLSVDLPPGVQRYVFVVGGELLPDPLNAASAYSRDGLRVSVLTVP